MALAFRSGETARYWWMPAMVFSTVLPTALHLVHALLTTLFLPLPLAAPVLPGAVGRAAYHPWAMVGAPLLVTGAVLSWLAMLYAALWVPGVTIFDGTASLWEPARRAMLWYLSLFEHWHGLISGQLT
ncbi:hypothetical protein [Mangrovicoccus ximenensis]|uniref:hypothetical protein n=1 Tax=Mangrovicoccus ximenensis TaxID=1911570 RepID=UPI000D342594|nr:hypothetical protein [Mangrovicoccus ximenensis]